MEEDNEKKEKVIKINSTAFLSIIVMLVIILIIAIFFGVLLLQKIKEEDNELIGKNESVENNELIEKNMIEDDDEFVNENIGDKVNYTVTVNNVELNKWRIFYQDNDEVSIIYEEYLPNSTQIAQDAGLIQGENEYSEYGVYSSKSRSDLINKLNDARKTKVWNSLLTPELVDIGATAKGGVDIETWIKSWNMKGYTELKTDTIDFSDGTEGYKVLRNDLLTSDESINMINLSFDDEGYSDSLYFPIMNNVNNESYYGYWIPSYSALGNNYIMIATDDGDLGNNLHGYYNAKGVGIRPVICIPSENLKKSETEDGVWDIVL